MSLWGTSEEDQQYPSGNLILKDVNNQTKKISLKTLVQGYADGDGNVVIDAVCGGRFSKP